MATESDIPVPVCEARGDQVGTIVEDIIKISVSQLSLEKQTQDEKHGELPTVEGENFLKSPSGVEVHCEVTPEIRKDIEEPDQTVKEGMDTLLLSTKDTSSDHNGVPEGSVEENFNTSADKASHERIITKPGEPVTKEVDQEFKEAELFEKEQSTTRTLVNEDKQIENHAESLHVDPENSGIPDLSQENSIDSLPEEQSRDVTPHGNATKEEEAAIDADNENKESLESFPPIVSSSHEERSTNAVLEEGTSDHTDGKTIVEVDKHQEGLESSSSGEAQCDVTYVSPDVSKSTENTDQTMNDGSDTLLLSPKLSDQPVESAANEETSAEEVHQHAEEVNSTDKPAEPEQQNKDSSVLTSEIDGHDKDDTRVLSQLSNDTSSDHRSIDDSSTENVAVSEEKLQEINLPSEQISSNAPCISKGEELNILVETADNKSVDEEAAEEDMSCLKSGVSTGESDQNEMTSKQDGLQNNHHMDGEIIDEVKEQHEVLENLSSGEARSEVNDFSLDVSKNTEESGSTDKDVVPEQCINDSPDAASEIDGRGVDEATVMTQLSKDTSSDNHITNDPTTEKANHESIITPGEAITKEVDGELEEAELSENERSTTCTLLNEDKHVENHAEPLHVGTESIDSTPEEQSRDVTLHGNATEEEEAAIDADNEHKESLESFPPIVSSSHEEESVNAVLQEGTSDHTDGKTIVEVNKHQEGLESSSSDEAHCEVTYVSSDFSKSTESTDQTMKDGTDTLLLSPKLSDQPVESAASEETSAEEIQHAEEVNSTDKDVEPEQHSKDSSVLTSEIDGHDKDDTRVVTQLSNDTSSNHMDEIDKVNEHQDVLENLPSGEAHSEANNFSPVSGSLEEENVNAVLQEVTSDHTNRIIDEVDKKEEATENPSTTVSTEDAEGDLLSQLDHSENKREDDSLKECEEVPLPLPLAREVGDVPTYLHEAQIEDGAPEKAEDTEEEHANSEHTKASDLVNKRSEGGTVNVTEEKDETPENHEPTPHKDINEDSLQVDGPILEEKEPEKDSEATPLTEAPKDDIIEKTVVKEVTQVENSIHSSQVASEATDVVAPCQDTERSFNVEQIQDLEDISGNEVEEKISNATGEEPQEAQDLAKSVTHEEDSPNERKIEAALENEDLSTELPQVADEDTEEPCLSEVRETGSQEEQILSASPGVLISDNEENKPIEHTVLQKEIPKKEETSLTAEEHPCTEDLNISKDIIGHSLEASNDNQQESSITEVFQEHTVISNEHVSESTSMESEVSGKNNDQAVGEASSSGDKTDSEKPRVIGDGSSAVTSETLEETDPSVCLETEVQVPHEEKEAEVINQETENDENIREALPNDASEDISESKEVNGEEIDSNNYKELTSSPISVPPEEVFTPLTDAPKDDIIEKTLVMEVPQVENSIDSSQVASEATEVVVPCQDTEKITDATGEETQEAQDLAKNVIRDDDSPNEGNTEAVLENEDLSAELPQVADKDTEEPCLSEVRETISQEEKILSTSPEVLIYDSEENKAIEPTVLQKEIPKDEETSLTAEEHPCAEDSNVSKDIIEHSAEASNDNQQESSITEVFEEHTVTSNEHVSESTSMESEVSGGDKTESEKTGVIDDGSSAVTTSETLVETDPSACPETEVQVPHGEKEAEVINQEAENDENIEEAIPNDASEDVSESEEVDVQEETDSNNYKELTSNPISVPPKEVSTSNVALEEHSTSNSSQEPGTETREGAETEEDQNQEPAPQVSELINDSPVERIERDTHPSRANDSAIQETGLTTEEHPCAEDLNVSKDITGHDLEASNEDQQESSITEVFEEHTVTSNEHVSESTSMESDVSGGDKTGSEETGVIDDGSSAVTTSEILEETDPSACPETEVQVPHEEKEAEVINQEAENDENVKEAVPNDASEDVSESKELDAGEETDSNTYGELTSSPISVPSEEVSTSNVALEEHSTSNSSQEPKTETREGAEAEEDQNQEPAPQVSELIHDSPVERIERDTHPSPARAHDSAITEEVKENIIETTTECKESDEGKGAQNEAYEEKTPATMVIDEEPSSATYLETKNGEEAPEIEETIPNPSSAEETSNSVGSLAEQNSDSNEAATTPTENRSGDDSINRDLEAIAQGCEPISTTEEEKLEADAEIKLDEAENEEIQGETTRENEIVKGDSLSTKEEQSPEGTGLTTEEHPCAGDLNVSKDITGHNLEASNDNQQESSITEVFEEHTVSSNEHVSESTSMESEVAGGDKTGSEETGVIDDGSSAVTTSEILEETDQSACLETEVQVPHEEKEAEVIIQEAEIDEHIKEALPNDASEDVSESKEVDVQEKTDSNTYKELTSSPISVPSEEVPTSNVALEEHSTSDSAQEPRTETREGAETEEDQNQEPAPQVSEPIQDSPVEIIERDTHPSPARAHDSTITEEMEENIKETTTDCKESDAGNGAQNEAYEEKTPATMVIDEETSSVTYLETENGEEAPEIQETIPTPSSAEETSNSAVSSAVENSDSNEAATAPTENKSGDDSINQDLEANAQSCEPISTTEEEKLEADADADAEIQGEITRENEIVKGDSLSTKEEQSPGVANVSTEIDEPVENVLHQEDRVTSNELNIARKEEEGDKIAAIPDKESEERDKKDEISSSDEVQAKDEEVLILPEEKREEEVKEEREEAYTENSDLACRTSEISERAISDDSQQDIPKDNENSTTLKKFSEDDSNKSRECEVPFAAVIEETMEETIRTDEVQEEKVGIALEDVVPESTGFKSNEVEEVSDIVSASVENPVVSTAEIIPELTKGIPPVAEYQETKLHGLPEELSTKDFEVKEAGLDDTVNIQSIKDISEECKESFEVSNTEKPVEGDPEQIIETGEVQETESIQNATASETVEQETEEQQLARGNEDEHEEEKNTYDIIPKQLESSYGAESEKVSEPIIHRTSIEDLPLNIGGIHSDDASEQEDKHVVLEADDTKNSIPENLDDKLSSEISQGEHEVVQPPKLERETEECRNEDGTNHEVKETSPMAVHSPAEKELTSHTEDVQAENPDEDEHEKSKTDEERENEEESSHEHEKSDLSSEAPVMVDMGDADVKVTPKKSHNILSGVGSKVKHSIAKVKKAITGKSSHPKTPSPSKVVN